MNNVIEILIKLAVTLICIEIIILLIVCLILDEYDLFQKFMGFALIFVILALNSKYFKIGDIND